MRSYNIHIMGYDYLMNIASVAFIGCYIPELYANYKNKNANIYNVPEKVVMLVGSTFALAFAIVNENDPLILNYAPIFALDIVALLMRVHYIRLAALNSVSPATHPEAA